MVTFIWLHNSFLWKLGNEIKRIVLKTNGIVQIPDTKSVSICVVIFIPLLVFNFYDYHLQI